jgi:hypothetical protein
MGGYAIPWGDLMAAGPLVSRYPVRGLTHGAVK